MRPFKEVHIAPRCGVQTGEDRFGPGSAKKIRAALDQDMLNGPTPGSVDSAIPQVARCRVNLTALSQRYNLYFVAYKNDIHVYEPRQSPHILGEPLLILESFSSGAAIAVGGYLDSLDPHQINHLIVGEIADGEELLVVAKDDGDVITWLTSQIAEYIQRRDRHKRRAHIGQSAKPSRGELLSLICFVQNVGKSAWGLALHTRSNLLGVSSNTGEITVFAYASGLREDIENDYPDVKMDHCHPPKAGEELYEPLHAKAFANAKYPTTRSRGWRIILPVHRRVKNMPSISFCDDADGYAFAVAAVDIRGATWLVNIWEPYSLPVLLPSHICDSRDSETGWAVKYLPQSLFQHAQNRWEALGVTSKELRRRDQDDPYRIDLSKTISLVPDDAYSAAANARRSALMDEQLHRNTSITTTASISGLDSDMEEPTGRTSVEESTAEEQDTVDRSNTIDDESEHEGSSHSNEYDFSEDEAGDNDQESTDMSEYIDHHSDSDLYDSTDEEGLFDPDTSGWIEHAYVSGVFDRRWLNKYDIGIDEYYVYMRSLSSVYGETNSPNAEGGDKPTTFSDPRWMPCVPLWAQQYPRLNPHQLEFLVGRSFAILRRTRIRHAYTRSEMQTHDRWRAKRGLQEYFPRDINSQFSILRTGAIDVDLVSLDETATRISCQAVNQQVDPCPENKAEDKWPWDNWVAERCSLLHVIPEISVVIIGSMCGRVTVLSLTSSTNTSEEDNKLKYGRARHKTPLPAKTAKETTTTKDGEEVKRVPKRAFRVEHTLPRASEEADRLRPMCCLLGIAVSPVPETRVKERMDLRRGGDVNLHEPRTWRLLLHYMDHTILSYEISKTHPDVLEVV